MSNLLLQNAKVCDAFHWDEPLDIRIADGRITEIRNGLAPMSSENVIDLRGYQLFPGLIDAHVHLVSGPIEYNDISLVNWAMGGVTAVRDVSMGSNKTLESYLQWAESVRCRADCCSFVSAGKFVTAKKGYCHIMPDGVESGIGVESAREAADAVRYLHDMGFQGIKTCVSTKDFSGRLLPNLSRDALSAIADTADALNMWVTVHVLEAKYVDMLLDCGLRDFAHIPVDMLSEKQLRRMAELDVYVVPTLQTTVEHPDRSPVEILPPLDVLNEQNRCALRNVRRFTELGGKVAMGTDTMWMEQMPGPVSIPVTELQQMAKAGMSIQEVIRAATLHSAHVCGFDNLGNIQVGKQASLFATSDALDETFAAFQNVPFVVNKGCVIKDTRNGGES